MKNDIICFHRSCVQAERALRLIFTPPWCWSITAQVWVWKQYNIALTIELRASKLAVVSCILIKSYMWTHATNAHIHAYPSQAALRMKSCLCAKSLQHLIHLFWCSFNAMWKFRRVLVCLSVCLAVLCWQFDVFSSPCLPCLSICLRAGSMFIFRLCLYWLSLPTEDHCEQWHNKGKEQSYWYTTTTRSVCVCLCVWVRACLRVCVCACVRV